MSEEKQFADGLIAKHPGENAPDFVKAKLSFKLDEFKQWVGGIDRPKMFHGECCPTAHMPR